MAKAPVKENQFDARRETLVVEQKTTWETSNPLRDATKDKLLDRLLANPAVATRLEYIRCSTGFIRHITVTDADVAQMNSQPAAVKG